ncbi:MAG: MotA/TolQ/ExbB proton channel family protein [Gammaproteobacteria bacterium]
MKNKSHFWPGIIFFSILFFGSFVISDGAHMMFNLVGLVVVLAGTLGAAFFSYSGEELHSSYKVAINSYRTPPPTAKEVVDALLDLSLRSRMDGLLALENEEEHTSVLFLRRALSMMVDGFKSEEVRDSLDTETYFFEQRRIKHERVFRHLASMAPAFGVTGSVIGLIGMLSGIGDTGVIIHTIPIALTSTLYGIVLANYFLTPIAENIYAKTQDEMLIHKLIIEGVTLIAHEYNTLRLQTKLESFLTPSVRGVQHKSLEEIRGHYEYLKNMQIERAEAAGE